MLFNQNFKTRIIYAVLWTKYKCYFDMKPTRFVLYSVSWRPAFLCLGQHYRCTRVPNKTIRSRTVSSLLSCWNAIPCAPPTPCRAVCEMEGSDTQTSSVDLITRATDSQGPVFIYKRCCIHYNPNSWCGGAQFKSQLDILSFPVPRPGLDEGRKVS